MLFIAVVFVLTKDEMSTKRGLVEKQGIHSIVYFIVEKRKHGIYLYYLGEIFRISITE